MGQTAVPIPASSEPRRWIPAIVGGVLLGEALWGFLHILVRDWAVPAITNALGQGPTPNQAAFEPLPLLLAFVETCVAGMILVMLMAWSRRGSRVVMVRSAQAAAVPSIVAAPPTPVAEPPAPVARVAEAVSPARPPAVAREPVATPASPVPAPAPVVAAPAPPKPPAPQPAPPKSKKPKVVYYNSVGEPIESDD